MADTKLFQVESELAVLSIILKNPDLIHTANGLRFFMFSSAPTVALFSEFEDMVSRKLVPDPTLVVASMESKNSLDKIGGKRFIEQLLNKDYSESSFNEFCNLVASSYKAREYISVLSTINSKDLTSGNIDDYIYSSRKSLDNLIELGGRTDTMHIGDLAKDSYDEIISRMKSPGIRGTTWGVSEIDKITGGKCGGDLWVIAGRPGQGKCLGKGTLVVMYSGELKNVEDIKFGDLLMGVDSKPRKVLAITSGVEQMYWIRQNRGVDYRVNKSHILSLKRSKSEKKRTHGEILNISVTDALARKKSMETRWKGYKVAVEFGAKELSVDPYYLGLWLGDGKETDLRIYSIDSEIVDYIQNYTKSIGMEVSIGDRDRECKSYNIQNNHNGNSIRDSFNDWKMFGNKHIPDSYLYGAVKDRLSLLAGLIDSDGYRCNHAGYEIIQKRKDLTFQIKYLCDSLGFRTSIVSKIATCQTGAKLLVWRLTIYGDVSRIPVKLERKMCSPWTSEIDWTMTGIKIEKDIIDAYYGFELDGDGLFLLEDMTVTHNSAVAVNSIYHDGLNGVPSLLIEREMRKQELMERLITIDTGIPNTNIRLGILNQEQVQKIYESLAKLKTLPIYLDTNYRASDTNYIESTVTKFHNKYGVKVVYLDYIQLLSEREENQTQEIGRMTRLFKLMANGLDICTVLLSQLNRNVESRDNKRPLLSDMKQSGAIEEDADFAVGLYRDEYYNSETKYKGLMEYIILKNRNGPTGTTTLHFDGPTNLISQL